MSLSKNAKNLTRCLQNMERAEQSWDAPKLSACLRDLPVIMQAVVQEVGPAQQAADEVLRQLTAKLHSPAYSQELAAALSQAGLPIKGEFPEFELPPFRLSIDVPGQQILLTMGRKKEKLSQFEPKVVAGWASERYRAVVKRPFNAKNLVADLLRVYEWGNRLASGAGDKKVRWGQPVELALLYDLLVPRKEQKREYPLGFFTYDLGRLRQVGLEQGGVRLEFGFSRDAAKSFVLPTGDGREERFSTLAIHPTS